PLRTSSKPILPTRSSSGRAFATRRASSRNSANSSPLGAAGPREGFVNWLESDQTEEGCDGRREFERAHNLRFAAQGVIQPDPAAFLASARAVRHDAQAGALVR